jgi:hypothetical protein
MFKIFREKAIAIRQAVNEARRQLVAEHDRQVSALISDHRRLMDEIEKKHAKELKEKLKEKEIIIDNLQRRVNDAEEAWKYIQRYGKTLAEHADNNYTEEMLRHTRLTEMLQRDAKRKEEIEKIVREINGMQKTLNKLLPGVE